MRFRGLALEGGEVAQDLGLPAERDDAFDLADVALGGRDRLVAQDGLDLAEVLSALEHGGRGKVPDGMRMKLAGLFRGESGAIR